MPRIPLPEYRPQVMPGGVGVTPSAGVTPIGNTEGVASEQLGASLTNVGNTITAYAAQFKQSQREADARGGDVQLTKSLDDLVYNPQSGYLTKLGRDAVDGFDDFKKAAEETYNTTRASLADDQARKIFDSNALRTLQYTLQSGSRHAAQQNKLWQVGAVDSRIDAYQGTAANYFNDEQRFGQALDTIKSEVQNKGQLLGWAPEQVSAESAKQVSKAYTGTIERQMLYDPLGAMDRYRRNQAYVDPAQRPVLEARLKTAVLPVQVKSAADYIMSGPEVQDFNNAFELRGEPLVNAVMQQESGGNQDAVSPKGAVGVMQLMPDTAREVAGEMGLPYDEAKLKSDAGYNKALGERYLRNMMARYAGNQTLALAAYNAGPGAVDKWIRQYGNPNTGEISNADFAAAIPYKETRDYVSNVSAKATGAPAPTNKRDTQAQLVAWVSQAEKTADAMHPGDFVFRDMLVNAIKGRVATIAQMQDAVQRQAQGKLMDAAMAVGQDTKPTTVDELLADPQNKDAWTKLDPAAKSGIIELVNRNARGDHVGTNAALTMDLFRRVHADEADPQKIRSDTQLLQYVGKQADGSNGINFADLDRLRKEIADDQNPEGNAFLKQKQAVVTSARRMLHASPVGSVQGDVAEEAAYRYAAALDQKIEQYRKEKKDPRDLFNPEKPDYYLAPGNVASFMPNMRDVTAKRAADVAAGKAPPLAQPSKLSGQSVYEAGKVYPFKQGNLKYLGGDPKSAASWQAVQ